MTNEATDEVTELTDHTTVEDARRDTPTITLTPEEQAEFARLSTRFLRIPHCPWTPNPGPQEMFLLDFGRESLYGGAAGGGKSIAILMAASQFLNVPGYSALILRKSFADFNRSGALMEIAEKWWGGKPGIKFDRQNHTYIFDCPGGGTSSVEFGALENINDRFKYQGGAYHFIGWDELTQQQERDYTYVSFSRSRRVSAGPLSTIPRRVRSTANPGGVGHEWVFKRFISPWQAWREKGHARPKRNFHPAIIDDNPQLDREDYVESLMELDPVTRAQLLKGDWNIRPDGRMFKRAWFKIIPPDEVPTNVTWVRMWDTAATDPVPGFDPDYTVGALVGRDARSGSYYIRDIRRWRRGPNENDVGLRLTAEHDTRQVLQAMEQEPGSGGKIAIHHYRVGAFRGHRFRGVPASGKSKGRTTTLTAGRKTPMPKILAAGPLASHAEAGLVHMVVDGSWDNDAALNELDIFPDGDHDDVVDALSGAVNLLAKSPAAIAMNDNEEFVTVNPWRPESVRGGVLSAMEDGYTRMHDARQRIDEQIARVDAMGKDAPDLARQVELADDVDVEAAVHAAWSM